MTADYTPSNKTRNMMMNHAARSLAAIIVLSIAALGCSSGGDESAKTTPRDTVVVAQSNQEAAPTTGDQKDTIPPNDQLTARTPPVEKPPVAKPVKKKPQPEQPRPEPERTVTVPSGSTLAVSLMTHLRTDSNEVGDPIEATTSAALDINGVTVIPAGATVRGRVVQIEEPHRTKGRAKITLLFESVADAKGQMHALETRPIVLEAEPDKISDEAKVAGGGVIGGVIGALASKNKTKGAIVGAVAGAAAGGAVALATKGNQLDLAPGHKFSVEVVKPAEIPVPSESGSKGN